MKKLKIGDKVKVFGKQDSNTFNGETGKVVYLFTNDCDGYDIAVQFDKPIPQGHNSKGYGKKGYCWNFRYENKYVTIMKINSKFRKIFERLNNDTK